MSQQQRTQQLLGKVQSSLPITLGEQARLALLLAFPAIISQLVTIVMEYMDTAMVGHLGAEASASIGLVSTTTWLMGGLCSSVAGGFAVLVAQSIGAGNRDRAKTILRKAIRFTLIVSSIIGMIGVLIAPYLPQWLGGGEDIKHDAYIYFLVFAASIPIWEINFLMASMLRSTGNMIVPSVVNIVACLLDIVFNYIFIFVLDLGVLGAALGTLCYMPGYGIGDAATTLVGQSIGAKRQDLQRSFSYITLILGVGFMTIMGILMYVGIPYLMPLMTPDAAVQALTVECLRIEAFAEPMYAASIVVYSIFVGAGDTKTPAMMNLGSMWIVRLPLAFLLAKTMGLKGVWIAMCIELCFRGTIFLIRLNRKTRHDKHN